MPQPGLVLVAVADGIARVTLNRPERLNALDDALGRELAEVFERLANDPALRVVTLTGAGRAFMAGGDVATFKAAGERAPEAVGAMIVVFHRIIRSIRAMDADRDCGRARRGSGRRARPRARVRLRDRRRGRPVRAGLHQARYQSRRRHHGLGDAADRAAPRARMAHARRRHGRKRRGAARARQPGCRRRRPRRPRSKRWRSASPAARGRPTHRSSA